jgi:hypothetical protein
VDVAAVVRLVADVVADCSPTFAAIAAFTSPLY